MSTEVALGWASVGMQALGTLGAATGAARMNRATIRGNKKAIALLDKNLSGIPEVSAAKQDIAKDEFDLGVDEEMFSISDKNRVGFEDYENAVGSTGFAGDFSVQDAYSQFQRSLDQNLQMKRKNLFSSLDKSLADIAEWETTSIGTIEAEKLRLENENRTLRTQDKWYENIF